MFNNMLEDTPTQKMLQESPTLAKLVTILLDVSPRIIKLGNYIKNFNEEMENRLAFFAAKTYGGKIVNVSDFDNKVVYASSTHSAAGTYIPEKQCMPSVFRRANGKSHAMLRANISDSEFVEFHGQRNDSESDSGSQYEDAESSRGEAESGRGSAEPPNRDQQHGADNERPGSPHSVSWFDAKTDYEEDWKEWLETVRDWVVMAEDLHSGQGITSMKKCADRFSRRTTKVLSAFRSGGQFIYQEEIDKIREARQLFMDKRFDFDSHLPQQEFEQLKNVWIECLTEVVDGPEPEDFREVHPYATAIFLKHWYENSDCNLCQLETDFMLYEKSRWGYFCKCIPQYLARANNAFYCSEIYEDLERLQDIIYRCQDTLDEQNEENEEKILYCQQQLQGGTNIITSLLEKIGPMIDYDIFSVVTSSIPLHSERARQLKKTPLLYKAWKEASSHEQRGHVRETDDDDVRDRALHAAGQAEQPAARHRRVARAAARARDHGAHDHAVLQDH
jgi:hypothetical protein